MKKSAQALATLVGLTTLTAATSAPAAAPVHSSAVPANHTRRLVLHETASHNVGRNSFVGTDRDRSPRTHKVVAYDSFTGHLNQRTGEVRFQLAFAFKGGMIVGRIKGVVEDPFDHAVLRGPILRGTGKFAGIDGSITAILTPVDRADSRGRRNTSMVEVLFDGGTQTAAC